MKYNKVTFWPNTTIKQYDINSLNANFNLVKWEWYDLEQYEALISFWTPYEEADSYSDVSEFEKELQKPRGYHEGIIYSGLEVDNGQEYKTFQLDETHSLQVKPGSIVYTIDLNQEIIDSSRYIIIENPVKKGYNHEIVNGQLTFKWGILNTWIRPIQGPTGSSNWSYSITFKNLKDKKYRRNETNLLEFRIPIDEIVTNGAHPLTYSNAYSLSFFNGSPNYINEISIPCKTWIDFREQPENHSYRYYLYITFEVIQNTQWSALFDSSNYQLLIW